MTTKEWVLEPVEAVPRCGSQPAPNPEHERLVKEFLASGATSSHLKNERGPISRAEVETQRELLRVAIQRLKAPVTVKRRENDLYLVRKETLTG